MMVLHIQSNGAINVEVKNLTNAFLLARKTSKCIPAGTYMEFNGNHYFVQECRCLPKI